MSPIHYLNQYWPPIGEVLWHSFQSNLIAHAQATILYNIEFFKWNFLKSLPGSNELTDIESNVIQEGQVLAHIQQILWNWKIKILVTMGHSYKQRLTLIPVKYGIH